MDFTSKLVNSNNKKNISCGYYCYVVTDITLYLFKLLNFET